jgi:hypothetical protein
MSISTYFRPNIHQNGPEILGVKHSLQSLNVYLEELTPHCPRSKNPEMS